MRCKDDEWTKQEGSYYGVTDKGKREVQDSKRNKYEEQTLGGRLEERQTLKRSLKDEWSSPEKSKRQQTKIKCGVGVLSSSTTTYFPS